MLVSSGSSNSSPQAEDEMPRQIHRLNATTLETLTAPGRHGDGGGLYLSISPGGARSWVFMWKVDGKRREMGLGSFRDVSLDTARERAAEARRNLASGVDPLTVSEPWRRPKAAPEKDMKATRSRKEGNQTLVQRQPMAFHKARTAKAKSSMTNNQMTALHEAASSPEGVPLTLWPRVMPGLERNGLVEQSNGRWFITNKGKRVVTGREVVDITDEPSAGRRRRYPEYVGKPPEAVRAFQAQRTSARRRGIPFLFTFEEWWAWWQIGNRWQNRGMGKHKFVMARFGDKGPYSPKNVYCATHEENHAIVPTEVRSQASRKAWTVNPDKPRNPRGAKNHLSRPVQTPAGVFGSATLAAEHFGFTRIYAAHLARTEQHGWRWADASACEHTMEAKADQFIWAADPQGLSHEDRESMLLEMELRRERNRKRSETMKARAAAKRAERLSPPSMTFDEADTASGGKITQRVTDQELQQKPRRRVKRGGTGFRGDDHDGCVHLHQ
jgi:hypothetical protein